MINIKEAENKFIKYTERFDLKNRRIKGKQLHSLRVKEICNEIAKKLNLNDEEIEIATLIGLLHDIGRFEQLTKYGTFRDRESVDHGDLGVKILKKNNYINEYINNEEYINTIYLAIKNHNKYQIEDELNTKQEMFCKLIRDADKIDIFYEAAEIFYTVEEIETINKSLINDEIISKIYEKKTINKNELNDKGILTSVLVMLAFLFDINYKASLEIIYRQRYIDKIFQRFHFEDEHTKSEIKKIQEFLNQYIKDKMQNR